MKNFGKAVAQIALILALGALILGMTDLSTPKVSMTTTSTATGSEMVTTDENGKVLSRVVCTNVDQTISCQTN